MTKHEWRKKEKNFYLPKAKAELIEVPAFKFVSIEGEGHPNSKNFANCIEALYAMSYGIKMNSKKNLDSIDGAYDYTVYPLEGIWDIREEAKKSFKAKINKDDLVYKLMIRQPDFIDDSNFNQILEIVKKKKENKLLDLLNFEQIEDGSCVQILHVGSYDTEPASFTVMENFTKSNNLSRVSKKHREIYLSDFRKVPEDKLKTVLRFQVRKL